MHFSETLAPLMEKPLTATLPNGLRIVLLERHDAPIVSWNVWANVGSVNETDETAGICHLIEHMIFKGTSKRPVGQIAREVEAAGGDMNAYTSFDETVFYINMPSRTMSVGLDVLADATSDPTFDEAELTREKEVVVEEISRAEDNPSQMVGEKLFQTAYAVHPYRRPIAGNRETVRGISRNYLKDFYHQWYVGPNLIFIGVGDFRGAEVLKKLESLLGKIRFQNPPAQQIPLDPPQTSPRLSLYGMNIEGHYMDLAMPIPQFTHEDVPALDLLGQVLGGGASSRLEQRLKEKEGLVSAINAYPYTPRYPGLLTIGCLLRNKQPEKVLQVVWEEVDRIRQEGIRPVELVRAKENLKSSRIYEKQTVDRLARKLGFFSGIAGDLDYEEPYYQKIASLKNDDLLKVAEQYLQPERMNLSLCHPKGEPWGKLEKTLSSLGRHSPKKKSRPSSEVRSFRLSSGVRLFVRENHSLPLVSIRSVSLGGLRAEKSGNNGISHLASLLLTKGTESRIAQEIAEESENISGHFDGFSSSNLFGIGSLFLTEKLTEGINLFCDLLLHPSFPPEEIQKEKEVIYTAIRNREDSLPSVAIRHFLSHLYPKHPYGLPLLGTKKSVQGIRREELIRFYQKTIHPKNIVLAISGDVDAEELNERLDQKFKKRFDPYHPLQILKTRCPPSPLENIIKRKEKFQAHVVYGFLGTTVKNRERYSLDMLSAILSGQGGRLFLELRDKQGLAYTVSFQAQEGVEEGYLMFYIGCDPQKLDLSLQGMEKELEKITTHPPTPEEMERAKRYLIGNYEMELQKNSTVASLIASNEILGIGWKEMHRYPQEIEKVTAEAVLAVAKKYIRKQNSVLSIVRP